MRVRNGLAFSSSQAADIPQPAPDVVPLPPTPHPVHAPEHEPGTAPGQPPEVIEPSLPGEHAPVRDPIVPGDAAGVAAGDVGRLPAQQ